MRGRRRRRSGGVRESLDDHRTRRRQACAVAERAVGVVAPARDMTATAHGAGRVAARGESDGVGDARNVRGRVPLATSASGHRRWSSTSAPHRSCPSRPRGRPSAARTRSRRRPRPPSRRRRRAPRPGRAARRPSTSRPRSRPRRRRDRLPPPPAPPPPRRSPPPASRSPRSRHCRALPRRCRPSTARRRPHAARSGRRPDHDLARVGDLSDRTRAAPASPTQHASAAAHGARRVAARRELRHARDARHTHRHARVPRPQHATRSSTRSAQVCAQPAVTATRGPARCIRRGGDEHDEEHATRPVGAAAERRKARRDCASSVCVPVKHRRRTPRSTATVEGGEGAAPAGQI